MNDEERSDMSGRWSHPAAGSGMEWGSAGEGREPLPSSEIPPLSTPVAPMQTLLSPTMQDQNPRRQPQDRPAIPLSSWLIVAGLLLAIVGVTVGNWVTSSHATSATSATSVAPVATPLAGGTSVAATSATRAGIGAFQASAVLTLRHGKRPVLLYVGALYCPYCAAERWGIVSALRRFGSFTSLQTMRSPALDGYKPVPTYDFSLSHYTSRYVAFEATEVEDQYGLPLQTLTREEKRLRNRFDPDRSVPFILVDGGYTQSGTNISPSLIAGRPVSTVQEELARHPDGKIAQAIVQEGDTIAALLCQGTGGKPASACDTPQVLALRQQLT